MRLVKLPEAKTLKGKGYTLWQMINPITVGSENVMSFVVTIDPEGVIPEHKHGPAEVALHFLEGNAVVTIDGEEEMVEPETVVCVPIGAGIGLKNIGKTTLKFIAVLSPPIDVNVCPVCGIETEKI